MSIEFQRLVLSAGVTLYRGDCLDILLTLSGIDAVVSDPPYGINHKPRNLPDSISSTGNYNNREIMGDKLPFDPTPLMKFKRISLFGANNFAAKIPNSGRWMAWNKLGDLEPWDKFSDVEFIWMNSSGPQRVFSHLWKGLCQAGRGKRRAHPHEKPISVMAWCMDEAKVSEGETVLDPYMGSGTTGIACIRTGRNFIGIEKDPAHFETARQRIEGELAQGDLFRRENVIADRS